MYDPKPNQQSGKEPLSDLAKSHIGQHLLFGISYVKHTDELIEQVQNHGEIIEITARLIKVKRYDSDEIFTLPPFVDELEAAPPGEYKLRSTGEVVINPDLIGRFKCISPPEENQD